VKKMVDLVLNL